MRILLCLILNFVSLEASNECSGKKCLEGYEGANACDTMNCIPEYFYCSEVGAEPEIRTCPGDLVFNVIKEAKCCTTLENCKSPNCPSTTPTAPSTTSPTITTTPTKTSKSTTPTTTTQEPTEGCHLNVECRDSGYYPKCTYCDRQYYFCEYAGATPLLGVCPENKVFNTDPSLALCIDYEDCPMHVDARMD